MKKIKKKIIDTPKEVQIDKNNNFVKIRGSKGEIERKIPKEMRLEKKGNKLYLSLEDNTKKLIKKSKSLMGLYHKIIENDIIGLTSGFEKKLEIRGIGYGAQIDNEGNLSLKLGFSHPVIIKKENDIEFIVEKNIITVKGINKEKVGNLSAKIRKIRPPDPYKGKGVRYLDEQVRKKEGKKAAAAK